MTKEITSTADLMWGLLQSFNWLDTCLQENMAARGHPRVSRTESQIMVLLDQGITSPVEMASTLGVSRQAINQSTKALMELQLIRQKADPVDRRRKILAADGAGAKMIEDAIEIVQAMEKILYDRLGRRQTKAMKALVLTDWGETPKI